MRGFLRPQIPAFPLMGKSGGIEGEGIERRDHLAFFLPAAGQRIAVSALENEHAMLEHPQRIQIVGMGGGKIDIPLTVYFMQLRRPNQLAHRPALRRAPNHDRLSIA